MQRANVYFQGIFAGVLEKAADGYSFQYAQPYLQNPKQPAISLSFPKQETVFNSKALFPFFFGLLAEGDNKAVQCRLLRIDEKDSFTRLLKTCAIDTIGGVTVEEASV